jgi:hypothetical protein
MFNKSYSTEIKHDLYFIFCQLVFANILLRIIIIIIIIIITFVKDFVCVDEGS